MVRERSFHGLGKYGVLIAFLFVVATVGCGDAHLKRKYDYQPPDVPGDIPRFVRTRNRVRGLEPRTEGQTQIDLHRQYSGAYERGFCDAAREWERTHSFESQQFTDLDRMDAVRAVKRGYWDGYTKLKTNVTANGIETNKKRG